MMMVHIPITDLRQLSPGDEVSVLGHDNRGRKGIVEGIAWDSRCIPGTLPKRLDAVRVRINGIPTDIHPMRDRIRVLKIVEFNPNDFIGGKLD